MTVKYPALAAALFFSALLAFRLPGCPERNAPAPGGLRDAVGDAGHGKFNTAIPAISGAGGDFPLPAPAEEAASQETINRLESLPEGGELLSEQNPLGAYLPYLASLRAAVPDNDPKQRSSAAARTAPAVLPLLSYKKIPVRYSSTRETDNIKVEFGAGPESGIRQVKAVFRLYQPARPDGPRRPFVLFFPPSGDGDFKISKGFCSYFLKRGLRCAYFEKRMRNPGEKIPVEPEEVFALPQFPPNSVETARRGLDALESMGVIRPGEKIGVAGISMGAIEASLAALTDGRIGAAALVLGGGNTAKILATIGGAGSKGYVELRENMMKARGWTRENLEREITPFTLPWDPLAYIKAIPEDRRLPSDRVLMINVNGDQTILNESSDELYSALTDSAGRRPEYDRLWLPVPPPYKHVGVLLRLWYVKGRTSAHLKRYLSE